MQPEDALRARLRALEVFAGELPAFDVDAAPEQPSGLFRAWLAAAIDAGVREPHAMTLATADHEGRPSARVLILKGLDGDAWQFASSRTSRKGHELAARPWAAMSFYWPELGRQVQLRGPVVEAGAEASLRDLLARSEAARAEVDAATWTLWSLVPDEVEFVQGSRQRRHHRVRYVRSVGGWSHAAPTP